MPEVPVRAYIGLGSNLAGDLPSPRHQVRQALDELARLPETRLLASSPLYQTPALGPVQPDYVNAVACLETSLPPLLLLDQLQALEQAHHRVRLERWGPRTLDLDILLYGDHIIDEPRLTVPHPEMTRRGFVLHPLAAIAPDLVLPCGTSLGSLLRTCPPDGLLPLSDV